MSPLRPSRLLPIAAFLAACAGDAVPPSAAPGGKSDATDDGSRVVLDCVLPGTSAEAVEVQFVFEADQIDVIAASAEALFFAEPGLRPSLNVRVQDGDDDAIEEFIEFAPAGLDAVPVTPNPRIEIDLTGDRLLTFVSDTASFELACEFAPAKLLADLGIAPVSASQLPLEDIQAVGFDIDDTLLFSSPTFARGFATGGTPAPGDVLFWTHTNACDPGCEQETITLPDGTQRLLPANEPSTPKSRALELIELHQRLGHDVYAITARPDINGDFLRDHVEASLGIRADHVFFEPDIDQPKNPKGKTDRIASLKLDVFYGDSDSDITDAMSVEARAVLPVRFLRSPRSTNRKEGKLNKYHPGYFEELILVDSYE